MDLLAQTSPAELQMISELLKRLIETDYRGFQLLSYSVNLLYINKFEKDQVKSLCTSILQYINSDSPSGKNPDQQAVPEANQKPLPPKIVEVLNNYNKNRDLAKQTALTQIQEILSKL